MALITDAATGWSSPVTLTEDEVWQTRDGAVYLTTSASPGGDDGILLTETTAIQLGAGRTVRYRKVGDVPAVIARELV
ncbi:MAG: hypothetical protein AAGK37_07300 [Pseudomonadota bacterium]